MNITESELFAFVMPLVLALHEKKVLDLAEIPHYYEDALMRRLDIGATEAQLEYQKGLARQFQRLANAVKGS